MASRKELLQSNNRAYSRDRKFGKLRDGATRFVPGVGPLYHATIAIIGEAPGRSEDEQGLPFVGASGQLMRRMLTDNGINPEHCWITNVVKYRPPNNRTPTREEIIDSLPYLMEELFLVQPQTIATMGTVPTLAMLGKRGPMSTLVGKGFPTKIGAGWKVIVRPFWHPSYILRQGDRAVTDYRAAFAVLRGD